MNDSTKGQIKISSEMIRENAEKLATLEDEWRELGSQRTIEYHFRFSSEDRACRFSALAQQAGFESYVHLPDVDYHVTASISVEPTAYNVTLLQEQLASFLGDWDEEERCYVDGWSYPPKSTVQFWPSADNRIAAVARAAVLFGSDLVKDPLASRNLFTHRFGEFSKARSNFGIIPSEFLRQAKAMRPSDPQPTASAFSQWVYSLYGRTDGSEKDVVDGTAAEQDIWERRKEAVCCNDNRFLRDAGWNWSLIHNGLNLRDRARIKHFSIPELYVRGEPLRASPDLVFATPDGSEVIIVEIKFSRQSLPKNLWPNIWAQLWCYAQLEIARNAQKVTVVGEIWGEDYTPGRKIRGGYEPGKALVSLRALVRRNPRASAYDRFFRRLFRVYSGRC